MSNVSRRVVGDRLSAEAAVLLRNGNPRDLTSTTVAFVMLAADGTTKVTEAATYVSQQPTKAVTFDAERNEAIRAEHGLINNDEVVFATDDTLPTGLSAATRYQVVDASPHRFKVRLTPSDLPINITTTGTGSHTYYQVGYVEYAYQSADVDTAGQYEAWFTVTAGGIKDHHPATGDGLSVVIEARS